MALRRHLFSYAVLIPFAIVLAFPFVWMFVTSVETLDQTRHFPPTLIPSGFHWSNYADAWNQAPFGRFFVNSMIVTGTAVASRTIPAPIPKCTIGSAPPPVTMATASASGTVRRRMIAARSPRIDA